MKCSIILFWFLIFTLGVQAQELNFLSFHKVNSSPSGLLDFEDTSDINDFNSLAVNTTLSIPPYPGVYYLDVLSETTDRLLSVQKIIAL